MEMPPKTRRQADSDIATLLRPKELMTALQALKELEFMERLCREVKTPSGRSIYLSEKANKSLSRLVETVEKFLPSGPLVGYEDIYRACKAVLGQLYQEETPPKDIDSFLAAVEEIAKESISTHRFYTSLDGLDFEGMDELRIGRLTVQRPDLTILQQCVANEDMVSNTWKRMERGLWMTGEITGSRKYAEHRFFEDVKAACGLLAVSFSTVLERGGAAVRLIPSMDGRVRPSAASWFSFPTESKVLCNSWSMQGYQALTLNEQLRDGMLGCEWFQELTRIIQDGRDTDAEQAVRRGIYWFFDAQTDTTLEMQLVKFWSCIECIFSFGNNGQTTEKIKQGLTATLTFGRYGFSHLDDWESLEKEIKDLYDLRCDAVHDAKHGHVKAHNVTTVSKWAAWVMLEVAGLISEGFESRAAIKAETDRVYGLLQKRRTAGKFTVPPPKTTE